MALRPPQTLVAITAACAVVLALSFVLLAGSAQTTPGEAAGQTLTFVPVADTYVSAADPAGTNNGSRTSLRVDASPVVNSYLRFDVQGVGSGVTSATLRVLASNNQNKGYEVYGVASTTWGETTTTFANAPAISPTRIAASGRVFAATWTAVDVTSLVAGNGLISLALTTPSNTALGLASREAGANAPQLVVITSGVPPTATSTASPLPATSSSTAAATITATPTNSPTRTATSTSTPVPTSTAASAPTLTSTPPPTSTATPTLVPPATASPTGTPTQTPVPTIAATNTPTPTATSSAAATATNTPVPTATSTPTPGSAVDATLIAAGDIAFCGSSGDEATAALLDTLPGSVVTLGDNAYESGTATEFAQCYDPTWGRAKARTRPATGNHEYAAGNAAGYYAYFGAAAGDATKGYYSYDLGSWHVIALNAQCAFVGGCGAGSPQETWLRADLQAHPAACTLAYWHQPRFSSGEHGSNTTYQPFWQALYEASADVVLNGHDHDYERFSPQTPSGALDSSAGIREFVSGTGGKSHYPILSPIANSEVQNSDTYGVLKLTLHATSYDWQFVPVAGATFTDSGSGSCH